MYYVMSCRGIEPPTAIIKCPSVPNLTWMSGKRIVGPVPKPLIYELDPYYPGTPYPLYEEAVPVMRDDLVEVLRKAGVDNLELFPAVLRNSDEKKEYTNYKAFNIVGVISCADMNASTMRGVAGSTMVDADFDSLVIDPAKTGGALMFRLAQAVSAIIVHEKVKKRIEARGIEGMEFLEPEDWSG